MMMIMTTGRKLRGRKGSCLYIVPPGRWLDGSSGGSDNNLTSNQVGLFRRLSFRDDLGGVRKGPKTKVQLILWYDTDRASQIFWIDGVIIFIHQWCCCIISIDRKKLLCNSKFPNIISSHFTWKFRHPSGRGCWRSTKLAIISYLLTPTNLPIIINNIKTTS